MKIAIIGAGAAGLAALRHSLDEGHDCEVFEQSDQIGGTWIYTEEVGVDKHGLPVHSSMYEGLSTNIPKELMQYEDFLYKQPEQSYISQPEVLKYIQDYATHFSLMPHIKFFSQIVAVCPIEENRWKIKIENVKEKTQEEKIFDAVFVCVGNYSVPSTPECRGMKRFQGSVIHSHGYRKSNCYHNRRVLIVGSGPSGLDISKILLEVAQKVYLSHRSELNPNLRLPKSLILKPEIKEFKDTTVVFQDNSEEIIDDVIFCTGYQLSFPFLAPECGIVIENNFVKYLYKHMINVKFSTMAFIGTPKRIFPFVIFGIQVRFFLALLNGKIVISNDKMMSEVMQHVVKKKEQNTPLHNYHLLGLEQGNYMDDLANTANIIAVAPVYAKLYKHVHTGKGKGNKTLSYRIVNDEEFVQIG